MRTFLGFTLATLVAALFATDIDDGGKRRNWPCRCQPPSSSSSSSSSECVNPVPEPVSACCETIQLDKYDFDVYAPVIGAGWSIFGSFDDGIFTTGPCGGAVTSSPFSIWGLSESRSLDHLKYMAFVDVPVRLPDNGNLTVQWVASGRTFKIDQSPFPCTYLDDNDFRLANSLLSTYDSDNGLTYEIMITNDRVYALYSKIGSFAVAVPMKVRKPCDWHKVKIVFYPATTQVSFHVDGFEGFRVLKSGFIGNRKYLVDELDGGEAAGFPTLIYYGFGTATFLDYYPVCQKIPGCASCSYPTIREALVNTGDLASLNTVAQYNPILGPVYPARYWDPVGSIAQNHIWGQGAQLNLTRLEVFEDVCWESL